MFKFLQPYNFIHCNDSLISEADKNILNTKLDSSFEYIKHYKSQCSELSLYKTKSSETSEEKFILISDPECLTQICPSTNFSIESIDTLGELTDLIHTDITLSTHSFPENIYKETISIELLRIECENKVAKEKLYYLTAPFEAIFTMLYKSMLNHECAFSIDTDDENKCVEYLDDIYNNSIINAFMNIYTLMESLEPSTHDRYVFGDGTQCQCYINRQNNIRLSITSKYHLYRSTSGECRRNIRQLRHAIVHNVDITSGLTKAQAVGHIGQYNKEIFHFMISYIEQKLR